MRQRPCWGLLQGIPERRPAHALDRLRRVGLRALGGWAAGPALGLGAGRLGRGLGGGGPAGRGLLRRFLRGALRLRRSFHAAKFTPRLERGQSILRRMMASARIGVAALALATVTAAAFAADDPRVADLVKARAVRVALDVGNPLLAARSPVTAEYRGLTVGVANALAVRIGVAPRLLPYTEPPEILDALKDKALDVGFLAIDPVRAAVVDFSPAL